MQEKYTDQPEKKIIDISRELKDFISRNVISKKNSEFMNMLADKILSLIIDDKQGHDFNLTDKQLCKEPAYDERREKCLINLLQALFEIEGENPVEYKKLYKKINKLALDLVGESLENYETLRNNILSTKDKIILEEILSGINDKSLSEWEKLIKLKKDMLKIYSALKLEDEKGKFNQVSLALFKTKMVFLQYEDREIRSIVFDFVSLDLDANKKTNGYMKLSEIHQKISSFQLENEREFPRELSGEKSPQFEWEFFKKFKKVTPDKLLNKLAWDVFSKVIADKDGDMQNTAHVNFIIDKFEYYYSECKGSSPSSSPVLKKISPQSNLKTMLFNLAKEALTPYLDPSKEYTKMKDIIHDSREALKVPGYKK